MTLTLMVYQSSAVSYHAYSLGKGLAGADSYEMSTPIHSILSGVVGCQNSTFWPVGQNKSSSRSDPCAHFGLCTIKLNVLALFVTRHHAVPDGISLVLAGVHTHALASRAPFFGSGTNHIPSWSDQALRTLVRPTCARAMLIQL